MTHVLRKPVPTNKDRQIKVWLDEESDIALRRLANELHIPVSRLVRIWIMETLRGYEKPMIEQREEKLVNHIPLLLGNTGAQRGKGEG